MERAADKAVELAAQIAPVAKTTLEVETAAHLTLMAGLMRGLEMVTMEEYQHRFAPEPPTAPREYELQRLQHLNGVLANDWRRIEKLVGREFTSPESVIDRVAYLVEQEQREQQLIRQRDDLLRAARGVLDDETVPVQQSVSNLTDVVERMQRELAGP
jgi:hypothetical protein